MKKILISLIMLILVVTVFCNYSQALSISAENNMSNGELGADSDYDDTTSKYYTLTPQDFADAKYDVTYTSGKAILNISNIKNMTDDNVGHLKMAVTSKATEDPEVDDNIFINCDKSQGVIQYESFSKFVELNQDLYIHIFYLDTINNTKKMLVSSKKIERPEYPKYADAYDKNTLASSTSIQLILSGIPKGSSTERKGNVKVGRISDNNILNNIKDNKKEGWEALLRYSKSDASPVYNKTQTSKALNAWILFEDMLGIQTAQLKDNEYYYLYIELDDENGKYYPAEAVTLTQASVYQDQNAWYMFFVGSDNFKWNLVSSSGGGNQDPAPTKTTTTPTPTPATQKDPTVAPTVLPKTGADVAIIASIVGLTVAGGIGFIKSKKLKDVK